MEINSQEMHSVYDLVVPLEGHQPHINDVTGVELGVEAQNSLLGTHTIEIHLEPTHLVDSLNTVSLGESHNGSVSGNPQMLYLLKSISDEDGNNHLNLPRVNEHGGTTVVVVTMPNGTSQVQLHNSAQGGNTEDSQIIQIVKDVEEATLSQEVKESPEPNRQRPKRRAALNNKYISDPFKTSNVSKNATTKSNKKENYADAQSHKHAAVEVAEEEQEIEKEEEEEDEDEGEVEEEEIVSDTSDEVTTDFRRCIVCLRHRKFTDDIFDSSKRLHFHIDVLIAHLNIDVKGTGSNSGICLECMNQLQRWHIFNCAIVKRHEMAKSSGEKYVEEPIAYESYEARIYKHHKKMSRVKEVFLTATHAHYTRRNITDKDWDFFCDHLFHSNSVKSEKSRELERFITSREKMSHMYCVKCKKMISNGKKGYTKHMQSDHNESPVMYPCDICGLTFPEKDMTASTEDYYPHWISHFYFNECNDCGKRFPTKRALGQHRHAVHKNRQVKCDKCGKVLANKMSLDLHLLRHLPENEKKKYMMKCKVCKRKIAQWNIKSHMATHNDERPWKCDHCDAKFKMKGALVSHRDVVHFNLKNHVCSICGEAFKSASSLRGHVRRHEGRKDYKCDVCLKEYYTYSALKGHKIVHQTVRNFVCEMCGKAFKKKKALEEHVTIHTGVKPHQCPICGREIRVKSNLYKHMKIHKKAPPNANAGNPKRKTVHSGIENIQINIHEEVGNSIVGSPNKEETILATNNCFSVPVSVSIENRLQTSGNTRVPTTASLGELNNAIITNTGAEHLKPQNISSDDTHSNSATRVQTLALQHQDLLNIPVSNGNYYGNTYFETENIQN